MWMLHVLIRQQFTVCFIYFTGFCVSAAERFQLKYYLWLIRYSSLPLKWGSPILFSWRVNGHFCFAWSVKFIRIYFFRDSWIYIFPSSGNWFSIFLWSVKYAIYFCVIYEAMTFAGIFFHFFGDSSVIKTIINEKWVPCLQSSKLSFFSAIKVWEDLFPSTVHFNMS